MQLEEETTHLVMLSLSFRSSQILKQILRLTSLVSQMNDEGRSFSISSSLLFPWFTSFVPINLGL